MPDLPDAPDDERTRAAAARIVFDDPLAAGSADDSDEGWSDAAGRGSADADVARFLAEKPPHHV